MIQKEEFESKCLHTIAKITMVLPDTTDSPIATLILLHGSLYPEGEYSIFERLPNELQLQKLCDRHMIMIVLPFMPMNGYYISNNYFDCDRFLAEELPAHLSLKYSFIPYTEVIIGGISMGGYGATLVGSHTRRFKRILSISGAFIQNDIIIGNPEIWNRSTPDKIAKTESFLHHFKPFYDFECSVDRNIVPALEVFSETGTDTSFFLSCGTDDWLYKRNIAFEKTLQKYMFNYKFVALQSGKHDADCFREGLWSGVRWLF